MDDEEFKKLELDYLSSIHKELRELKYVINKLLEKMG